MGPKGVEFYVSVDLIELHGSICPRDLSYVGFGTNKRGCVASLPELVRLRCETVVSRGKSRDYKDLRELLQMTRQKGLKLPTSEEEMEVLVGAVELLKDEELEVAFIDILDTFMARGQFWRSWQSYLYFKMQDYSH